MTQKNTPPLAHEAANNVKGEGFYKTEFQRHQGKRETQGLRAYTENTVEYWGAEKP